jgi:hypothetical protein
MASDRTNEPAANIERRRNLYVDIGMCMAVLLTVVSTVTVTHALVDWLQLAIQAAARVRTRPLILFASAFVARYAFPRTLSRA